MCWKSSRAQWQRREESSYPRSSRFTTAERKETETETAGGLDRVPQIPKRAAPIKALSASNLS